MIVRHPAEDGVIADWLAKLSLKQKIGQMTMAERMHATPQDVSAFGLGSLLSGGGSHPGSNSPADWVEMNDEYWVAVHEGEGASGIPLLFGVDAVHGHNNVKGATLFPHNIGLGAAGSVDLVAEIARVTAREILATGLEWNFAPTLAVVQNPQWGRTYESFGDDPDRAARFGEAYVRALQAEGVMGCAKHWVGDGATMHGMDQGETRLSFVELERTHIAPYYPSLNAGVMSVMISFNSWNGKKCHGHEYLISDLLKAKLGFAGIVVSDYDGVDYLDEDFSIAVTMAVNAGIDMFMVPERWRDFIATLMTLVETGAVSMARIDDAVARILRGKLRLGLLDAPRPSQRKLSNSAEFGCTAHRELAREAVRRSLVLLKNDAGILPLGREQRVLVAGRSAHSLGRQCGGWTISWQGGEDNDAVPGTTVWQGIAALAKGAQLSAALDGAEADPGLHDVAVVVVGERPYAEGYGDVRASEVIVAEVDALVEGQMNTLEPYGASLELTQLHPEDISTISRIQATGVPVVTILVSGRPLIINRELEASAAFISAWLPGSEAGAIADVLFGKVQFEGRLPMPWPDRLDSSVPGSAYIARFDAGYGLTMVSERVSSVDNVVLVDYKNAG